MFFKPRKAVIKPTQEQVELYGNHIYAILSNTGDVTPFDKLVCDAFTYFWMIEKSKQSEFLVANPVSKIDAIIATAYINSLTFLNGVRNSDIKQQYTSIYFKKIVQVICKEYPSFSVFISEMFASRIKLYNSATEKYDSDLQSTIDAVFEELQRLLSFDKVEQKYKPYSKDSPLVLLSFSDLMTCQGEITAYRNVYSTLYEATNEQIKLVLMSLDADAVSDNRNVGSVRYAALRKALLGGLEEYTKKHPSPILTNFGYSLEKYFASFLNEEPSEEYRFSISVRNESSMEYVEFNFDEYVLEVSCGGSVYSPGIGSDSYTNWFYSIWDDGSEDNDGTSVESFDIIYEILSSTNAEISIDSPDKFYYYPAMGTSQTDIDESPIDIPSLWNMEPSYHGQKVRIFGRLWYKQTDTLWCTLYAEHYRKPSVTGRVELRVNLLEPLPKFLWERPRIYTTEIPMVGVLIYDPTDGSYSLMDAIYDEYWRDENGIMVCRRLNCPRNCSEQCPIHCNNVAKIFVDKGDYDSAIAILKKATEKTLDYADNWLMLASCYLALSMYEEAEHFYFKTIKLDPKNKQALWELSVVSLRIGKFANARKYAAIYSQSQNDSKARELSQLIQNEILQYSNNWPTYNIPDAIWDSIRKTNTSVYWDMVLSDKLAHLAAMESAVSTFEYKQQWKNLKTHMLERASVAQMRSALQRDEVYGSEKMCVFDVIATYERKIIQY